ncbi:MAG: hypothetical protein QXN71_02825 [Candidatus Aenigmatarchaeota archaeon]
MTEMIYGIITRYIDDEPFKISKNLVIFCKTYDSIVYREVIFPESFNPYDLFEAKPSNEISTEGKPHRIRDIEYELKKECRMKGKNLIETSIINPYVELEIIRKHMEKLYNIRIETGYPVIL